MLSPSRTELLAATFLATFLLEVAASPSPYAGFEVDDVLRPVYRGNQRTRELKADTQVVVKSDISVVTGGEGDGRAASRVTPAPITPTPMAESLKMVTKQLLRAPSATDMVATDVRTPPKVKSQVKSQEAISTDFVPLGKGEAQPVVLVEDSSGYEIITAPPVRLSTPPTQGLSTWILLSNGEQSTLATNRKKVTAAPTPDPKKTHKPTMATPTIEKVKKPDDIKVMKPVHTPTALPLKKQNSTNDKEDPSKTSTIILQDPKFKNKTPVVVGRPPAQNKTDVPPKKGNEVPPKKRSDVSTTPSTLGLITRRRPISISPTAPTRHVYDMVPTTSLLLETGPVVDDTSTVESTTNKSTRRPTTTKKKKKNKNRRRRPTKDSETAESKVEETSVAPSNKIDINTRPISTRIYNYLAREVMPSVGVGLVGLVLTAGLAGLFLYPFGGGIARRNYDKGSGPLPDHQMYYYNSYSPHPEHDHLHSNAQPEETVFGQVLSSMNQNTYSPSYDTNKYSANNKYRYGTHDFAQKENDYTVNGYAGSSDYSTLPDSIKNSDYGIKSDFDSPKIPDYAPKTSDYSLKTTDYSKSPDYAIKPSDYSGKTDFSVHDSVKNPDYAMPEASKYYSMDPISSHYKLTDNSPPMDSFKPEEPSYPSLTEYSSYTNAASVGTVDSFRESLNDVSKNDTSQPVGEDKSDKSQPHFSALVGSPQFTNTDFVGSVSLTGGYGAHDNMVRHRTGALAAEHGPRSLNVNEDKNKRSKRDVHDDFSNEIDGGEHRFEFKKPSSEPPVITTESSMTSTAKYIMESTTNSGSIKDGTTTTTSDDSNSSNTVSSAEGVNSETTTYKYPNFLEDSNEKDSLVSPNDDPSMPVQGSNSGGFLSFITRLAQMKLKIGITLLRTTGEALTRYLDVMAKRMEDAVRTMENRRRSLDQKRQKRDLYKPINKDHILRKRFKKHPIVPTLESSM